jgi:hypothetical protein
LSSNYLSGNVLSQFGFDTTSPLKPVSQALSDVPISDAGWGPFVLPNENTNQPIRKRGPCNSPQEKNNKNDKPMTPDLGSA